MTAPYVPACPACRREEPIDLGEHACPGCTARRARIAAEHKAVTDAQVRGADSTMEGLTCQPEKY